MPVGMAENKPIEPETGNADAGNSALIFNVYLSSMKKDLMPWFILFGMIPMAVSAENKSSNIDTIHAKQLEDVVVYSLRAKKNTPMAFTNLAKVQLQGINQGKDMPYLLSLTPNVIVTSDAGNGIGYTSIRVRGTDAGRINVTVNGIPQNDAESSQLYWVNMGDLASSIQSVQIQRGVGTSTNGAGAFGATINLQTDALAVSPYLNMDFSAGSYYSHKETLRFATGLLGDHWALQGRLSNIGSKGYVERASTKLNSYFLQAGYFADRTMLKLITFNGTERTYLAWDYASKYQQSLYGRRYNPLGEYRNDKGELMHYKGQTDNYHQQNYQMILTQMISADINLHAALHYTKGNGYYEQYRYQKDLREFGLAEIKYKSDVIRRKMLDNDFYGAVADVTYAKNKLTTILGGGWNRYVGDHIGRVIWAKDPQTELLPDMEYYRNRAKKADGNVYAKATWQFLPSLSAFADLQYRHVGYKMQDPHAYYGYNTDGKYIISESFDFFNPKFGLTYDPTWQHSFYLSYAISHREPIRDHYEEYIEKNLAKPQAERLNDMELGYTFRTHNFSMGANLYWMDYDNQFVLTGELDNTGNPITRNVKDSYRMGVELQTAWMPLAWLKWETNASFSKNRVRHYLVTLSDKTTADLGTQPLSFSPSTVLNSILTFTHKGFESRIVNRYVSSQNLTNSGFENMIGLSDEQNPSVETLQLNSHFTTDVDLRYKFALPAIGIKHASVGISLYNIFSKKYDTTGWAAPQYEKNTAGQIMAVNRWGKRDQEAAGFAPAAPFNWMAHLSISF